MLRASTTSIGSDESDIHVGTSQCKQRRYSASIGQHVPHAEQRYALTALLLDVLVEVVLELHIHMQLAKLTHVVQHHSKQADLVPRCKANARTTIEAKIRILVQRFHDHDRLDRRTAI